MLKLQPNMRANVLPGQLRDDKCGISVRLDENNLDVKAASVAYQSRLFNFEIGDESYLDPALIEKLERRRIKLMAGDRIFEIGKHMDSFRKTSPVFMGVADDNLLKKINFLSAFGFQIHIDMNVPPASVEILADALDFYLHNPLLRTPIEPFHSLLKTVAQTGPKFTLWDTEYEKTAANIYIGDNGTVSLSARWNNSGLNYGTLENSWADIENSNLYKKLSSFAAELFREKSPCIFCRHMDICGGFLKAIDKDWPCDPWIETFDMLKNEVKNARAILKNHSGGES